MRTITMSAAILIVAMTTACPQQPKKHQGLIVARSVFKDGPSPATMMILKPGQEGWSRVEISVPAARVKVQPGQGSDGNFYYRSLDESGNPTGKPQKFTLKGDRWSLTEAAVDETTIDWQTDAETGLPKTKTYELAGGNVFHKCFWFKPAFGKPGILTISANLPHLQIWRESSPGKWQAETLFTSLVGGREHRFRDVEAGDIDGDGRDEIVIVTHDRGAVYVLEQTGQGFEPNLVHHADQREFVHEVEIGDLDGDGKLEFYTTPSEPNRLDGTKQAGRIDRYQFNPETKGYDRTRVATLQDRHAKEILVTDLDGDGRDELYAALEAEGMSDPTAVVLLRVFEAKGGTIASVGDVELGGSMCRFLNSGDTNGDGKDEIIASTRDAGIYDVAKGASGYHAKVIVPGYASGGFEHATSVFDWDQDGKDDIFVASDKQKKLSRYFYAPGKETYAHEDVADFEGESYFVWNVMPLSAGE